MHQGPERPDLNRCDSIPKAPYRPPTRITDWVSEHIEEDGLGEFVELRQRRATLSPQRVGAIQHLRDPPLIWEWWDRNREGTNIFEV
jgi:hypothetical protein